MREESRLSDTEWWACPGCGTSLSPTITWHLCIQEGDVEVVVYDLEGAREQGLVVEIDPGPAK